jgi:hypothetical protein
MAIAKNEYQVKCIPICGRCHLCTSMGVDQLVRPSIRLTDNHIPGALISGFFAYNAPNLRNFRLHRAEPQNWENGVYLLHHANFPFKSCNRAL